MGQVAGIGGWVVQVLAWTIIFAVAAILSVSVLIPRVAGAMPYTILTGSMRPHYPPGTLVVVRPAAESKVVEGDVVTYQLKSGQSSVVTHRVVQRRVNLSGKVLFITQGDANTVADAKPVKPIQLKGKLWYAVPYLGYVNTLIMPKERHITLVIVVSFLLCYSTYMFTSAARKSRQDRQLEIGRGNLHD